MRSYPEFETKKRQTGDITAMFSPEYVCKGCTPALVNPFRKGESMNASMKVLAALALLSALAGCAQLGMPGASGVSTTDPLSYEPPADG
jgi:hypothetical protein